MEANCEILFTANIVTVGLLIWQPGIIMIWTSSVVFPRHVGFSLPIIETPTTLAKLYGSVGDTDFENSDSDVVNISLVPAPSDRTTMLI